MMTPQRALDVERICQAALELEPSARSAFLAEACAGDDALRQEVESLLAHESGAAGFLSTPAVAVADGLHPRETSFIGRRLGPYQVLSLIDVGGMGEVYRARDQKLGRDVAIKILPPAFTADAERLARFAREARVLAALNHPHIGAIYGLEEGDGVNALVLELVEGETLSARIERGPIPTGEALRIARQIADALDASHQKGIVHRDLKPANIKITPAGEVKVLDFGLAKAAGGDAAPNLSESPTITVAGTRQGVLLGTAAYMSPEQARGQAVDKRADIWAFGGVLYEMLAGRAAFSGSTVSDTLAAILEREPDWTALPAATPVAIHRVLRRCLEKDAKLRLHDIADARIEVDEALEPNQSERAVRSFGRLRMPGAAVAVLIAAVFGVWAISRARQPDTTGPLLRLQLNPPTGGQFGRVSGYTPLSLALSPDGKTVVYGATVDGKFTLWLHPLDGTRARVLPDSENAFWPSWSPDGRNVAFTAKGKLKRIDVAGGTPFAICDMPRIFGWAWMPDNRILVGVPGGTLATVPASGCTLSPLTTLDQSMADISHVWPQVLPGGHFLYYGASSKPEHDGVIYAASFEKPNVRIRLVTSETGAVYASGPDGKGYLLWQRNGTLVAQEFDGATLKFSGEPRPIADAVGTWGSPAYLAVAVSNNGTLVHAAPDLFQLTRFDRTGKQLGTLGEPGQFHSVRFSLDGKQIATTRTEVRRDMWLIDVERGISRRTTFDSRGGFFSQWSPDGRWILFVGDNATALYRKDPTGVASDERLAPWPFEDYELTDWSRDGHSVLNTRRTVGTQDDIWVVPVTPDGHLSGDASPKPYLRTPANEAAGRFSPEMNPRWVAYQSDESGRYEIYLQSFPEPHGPHRISTNGGSAPQWGRRGRELFYQAPGGKVMVVSLRLDPDSVEASAPRELFRIPPESFFEVAPDGESFLVNMPDPAPRPLTVIVNWPTLLKQTAPRP